MTLLKIGSSMALLFMVAACGGGGNSVQPTPAPVPVPVVEATAAQLAQICAKENPLIADATAKTRVGVLGDEKKWIKAYMNERYLWYRDIPLLNPDDAVYNVMASGALDVVRSVGNYFYNSRTSQKTASGSDVDKFSFVTDTNTWNNFTGSTGLGYGLMVKSSEATGVKVVMVSYVYPNTPAMTYGLARGDQIVSIDGVLASDTTTAGKAAFEEGLNPTKDIAHTFVLARAGETFSITLLPEAGTLQQAEYKVLTQSGRKLGYLLFNSHVLSAENDLVTAMNMFKRQGVSDLVVDLRYNGGGYLGVASGLAYSVAGSAKADGKIFEQVRFSDKRSSENSAINFLSQGMGNQTYPSLNLTKIYVLVSGNTCSASESFVNGLRGVDVQVELIGHTTCGKPYAFYPQDNCGLTYAAMEMEGVNAKGEGGFSDGILPQCVANDDLSHPLGDPAEGMLSVALKRMQGQTCSQASSLALGATSLKGMALTDNSKVVRPEWQNNKFLMKRH
jgi:carboxyl-terminal processing protease